MMYVLIALVSAAVAGALTWYLTKVKLESSAASTVGRAELEAKRVVEEAEAQRRETVLEAKDEAIRLRSEMDREVSNRRRELERVERRIEQKEEQLDRKNEQVERRDKTLQRREKDLDTRETELDTYKQRQEEELQRVAMLTTDQAREILLNRTEQEMRDMLSRRVHELEQEAKAEADRRSRKILATTIQRIASDYVAETTVSVVPLPSDDMKGRIIGREGRNIRALEQATGVELIVDDTPGAIILSSFDPFRREVARQTISRLIADGHIHPARIEEVVEKVKAEMEEAVRKEGEAAAFELGLYDLHPDVLRLMGRLKFRTSYGQNVLNHSREVAFLAGIMAKELGLNGHVAARAAFLHDIGKAIDRDLQGTHLELGLDFLRKHGESEPVLQAVAAHHMDIDWPSLEAMIVQAADAISAARPGARRDILESYVKRLEKLESIADSFEGVSKAFALQAGREIRIVVESDRVSDEATVWLSKDIAKRIENELEYPGQIKVTVIRETRAVEYAR
jgi:ribonucrease Y